MAHMVVDEIHKLGGQVNPHGEMFKKSCMALEIDDSRTASSDELSLLTLEENEKIVGKIHKLMALSGSPNQFEAEVALQKAHHLMTKYNIKAISEERQTEYALRPVGRA